MARACDHCGDPVTRGYAVYNVKGEFIGEGFAIVKGKACCQDCYRELAFGELPHPSRVTHSDPGTPRGGGGADGCSPSFEDAVRRLEGE